MSSIPSSYVMTLYIRPETGPTMPLELDMLEIEMSVMRSPATSDRDEARVQEIVTRIKRKFPNVEPQSRLQQVRYLIGRLNHISIFNGVVLQLPGTIEGDSPTRQPSPEIDEFQRQAAESVLLRRQYDNLKQQYDIAASIAHRMQEENRHHHIMRQHIQTEKEDLYELQQETEAKLQELHEQLLSEEKKYKDRINALEKEKAQFQTELELLKTNQASMATLQQDLAVSRQKQASADKVEQQLRATIGSREQEIRELREQINKMTQNQRNKSEDNKEPWLDV